MPSITLQVPDALIDGVARSPEDLAREIQLAAALRLYESGRVTEEGAAALAQLPRPDFRKAVDVDESGGFLIEIDSEGSDA